MESPVAEVAIVTLSDYLRQIRSQTESLVSTLSEADAQLQSMPDVSPAKWHLAHTTWFFETFILCEHVKGYRRFNAVYNYLFNSYYNGIGEQYPRHQRGLISRPSLAEVIAYRHHVTAAMGELLERQADNPSINKLVELGIHHEQQHQELLLTDIKHCLFHNPTYPSLILGAASTGFSGGFYKYPYGESCKESHSEQPLRWLDLEGGLCSIGFDDQGFAFDNERPSHPAYLPPAKMANRLVTNGEYLAFISDKGYQSPEFWLSDGWAWLQSQQQPVAAPLYWVYREGQWYEYTLYGLIPLDLQQPLLHVNYYEATAYANWLGLRLPTEFEWEAMVRQQSISLPQEQIRIHPDNTPDNSAWFGTAWQWTASAYGAYPGFTPDITLESAIAISFMHIRHGSLRAFVSQNN